MAPQLTAMNGVLAAPAFLVNGLRHQFLAGAAFADQQDAGIGPATLSICWYSASIGGDEPYNRPKRFRARLTVMLMLLFVRCPAAVLVL